MLSDDDPLFTISSIAKMFAIHAQTLRLYERHGLITLARTQGNTRLYSWRNVRRIRLIIHLTRELGVNLAGVDIILSTQRKIDTLQQDIDILRQNIIEQLRNGRADPQPSRALMKVGARTLVKVRPTSQYS